MWFDRWTEDMEEIKEPKLKKADKLEAKWSKKEHDIMICYPNRPDGHFLHGFLVHARDPVIPDSFLKELENRGYDLTTLKFSIEKKSV